MKRSRPPRPAVWELPDRLGMYWNEPARRSYGNAADRHLPPSRGRPDQGLHSLPEEAQPGTVPMPPPRQPPGLPAPASPGGVLRLQQALGVTDWDRLFIMEPAGQ